jgi:hypothetical protein
MLVDTLLTMLRRGVRIMEGMKSEPAFYISIYEVGGVRQGMLIHQGQSLTPSKPLTEEWQIVLLAQYARWTKSNSLVHFFIEEGFKCVDMASARDFLSSWRSSG